MTQHLFSRAFANALQDRTCLSGVALPSGIKDESQSLIELVRHANLLRSHRSGGKMMSDPNSPYAVLYLQPPMEAQAEFEIYDSEGDLVPFRTGDRLFVGSERNIATIAGTVPVVVGLDYPNNQGQNGYLSLKALAKSALVEIHRSAGLGSSATYLPTVEVALENIFRLLADAHENSGNANVAWNAIWFDHINLGLNQLVQGIIRIKSSLDLQSFFSDYLYAAFSLPRPKNGFDKRYSKSRQNKTAIGAAIKAYWRNSTEILISISMLKNYPEYINLPPSENHPISQIDWSTFDQTLSDEIAEGSELLAWAIHERGANARLEKFAELTEDQFFDPRLSETGALHIIDSHGGARVHQVEGSSTYIVNGVAIDQSNSQLTSPDLSVIVPLRSGALPTAAEVTNSTMKLVIKSKGDFSGGLALGAVLQFDGQIRLSQKFEPNGNFKFKPKKNLAALQLDLSDSLWQKVIQSATASFVFVPPGAVGAMIFGVTASGELEVPDIICQSEFEGGEWKKIENHDYVVESNKTYQVVLFAEAETAKVLINGQPVDKVDESEHLWQTRQFICSGLDKLAIDDFEINLVTEIDGDFAPESPIIAAILKTSHSKTGPKAIHRETLRGQLESRYSTLIADDEWSSSLGHVVLPSDRNDQVSDVSTMNGASEFAMTPQLREVWSRLMFGGVPSELKNSVEAENFRNAFKALDMGARLKSIDDENSSLVWASKTSWADLVNDPRLLTDYLETYSKLVSKANSLNNYLGRFWATYPFSVSVWNTSEILSLVSVLLSPLHPIRLSWLAKIEANLRGASNAAQFCGTVEGWNFPVLGPTNTANGKLIAVPSDSGSEQLFLGWSMMVTANIDHHDALKPPAYAGNLQMPGVSSAGLNASTVRYALQDFRRLHPYVSTLSIDLAARSKVPKLTELDDAVIHEFQQWVSEDRIGNGLVGGVRVYDSLNRQGQLPREVQSLSDTHRSSPITWKRYSDNFLDVNESNIRILQDSGVAIVVSEDSPTTSGEVGEIPFRRFEIPEDNTSVSNGEVSYRPVIRDASTRGSFPKALNAIERQKESAPVVGLQIQGNSPLIGSAQWTISGESMISPAALAALLKAHQGTNQMLWEWHPPFLGDGSASSVNAAIEKRSYFTLAKIPSVLIRKLKYKLTHLLGRDATDADAENVFGILGTRGIGLSALVAAGGSQLTGALGFYSVFLFDGLPGNQKNNRFIMPIDVCNDFLVSLAGGTNPSRDKKRADLLVIELKEKSLCFTPLEIKFYGSERITGIPYDLPEIGSADLKSAAKQAENTLQMLQQLRAQWEQGKLDLARQNEHQLKANALATFIEAAMRISPHTVDVLTASAGLNSVIDGTAEIRLGRPLVAFFTTCGSKAKVKLGIDLASDDGTISHAEFICDPRAMLQQIDGGGNHVLQEWGRALDWALKCTGVSKLSISDIGSGPGSSPEPQPESNQPPEPQPSSGGDRRVEPDTGPSSASIPPPEEESDDEEDASELPKVIKIEPIDRPVVLGPEKVIRAEGVRFAVGDLVNSAGNEKAIFWPANTALNQMNIGVVGDLGTGKTQLVKALVKQLRDSASETQPTSLTTLILDYKRDYQDEKFINSVNGKVLEPRRIPLDIFRIVGVEEKDVRQAQFKKARDFRDVIRKIYGGVGPVQGEALTNAIMNAYNKGDGSPTINEIASEYSLIQSNADAVSSLLSDFVNLEIFSSKKSELKTLAELMSGSVLVLSLNSLGQDTQMKNSLVTLFLNQYFEYMNGLEKWPYQGQVPNQLRRLNSYLVVDEATNIMTFGFPVLMQLLLQGREFGVGVLLSSQYLSHFKVSGGENYGEPLLTWFIHKVPNVTKTQLTEIGLASATDEDVRRIKDLQNHGAYFKSLNFSGKFIRGKPFFEL